MLCFCRKVPKYPSSTRKKQEQPKRYLSLQENNPRNTSLLKPCKIFTWCRQRVRVTLTICCCVRSMEQHGCICWGNQLISLAGNQTDSTMPSCLKKHTHKSIPQLLRLSQKDLPFLQAKPQPLGEASKTAWISVRNLPVSLGSTGSANIKSW